MIRPYRARVQNPNYMPEVVPDPEGPLWAHDYGDECGVEAEPLFCHLWLQVDDVLDCGGADAWLSPLARRTFYRGEVDREAKP